LTAETEIFRIYHFPVEPLYNVQSMVEERIGEVVLNDPVLNPFRNCSATVQYELHIVSVTILIALPRQRLHGYYDL
jgi:hypothetical protein